MSKQKQKGTRFESAVVGYLNANGIRAERVALHGKADCGDVRFSVGALDAVAECKDRKRNDFPRYVDEAELEALNARASFGVAIAHREGCGAAAFGDNLAVMTLDTLVQLVQLASGTIGEAVERGIAERVMRR